MIYAAARSALFRMDAERAHGLALRALRVAGALPLVPGLFRALTQVKDDRLAVEAFGVRFANPIGLAAGYDKDGLAVRGLFGLGFGHVEIGTLTRGPQPGNTRPLQERALEIPPHAAHRSPILAPVFVLASAICRFAAW